MNDNSFIKKFLKGILIGFGIVIPGISGGTAAIITGIFYELLNAVGMIFVNLKKSLSILIPVGFGAVIGGILLSLPISYLTENYKKLSIVIFSITSFMGILFFIKNCKYEGIKLNSNLFISIGIISALSISEFLRYSSMSFENCDYYILILLGIPLSIALILPGISFSYMLLFLGLYNRTIDAISNIDIFYLATLCIGILSGTFIFSKFLNKILNIHPREIYSFIFGFVIYSFLDIIAQIG